MIRLDQKVIGKRDGWSIETPDAKRLLTVKWFVEKRPKFAQYLRDVVEMSTTAHTWSNASASLEMKRALCDAGLTWIDSSE